MLVRSRRNMGKSGFSEVTKCSSSTNSFRSITLTKNSQFYVRHGDVERLISQGYLQRLS